MDSVKRLLAISHVQECPPNFLWLIPLPAVINRNKLAQSAGSFVASLKIFSSFCCANLFLCAPRQPATHHNTQPTTYTILVTNFRWDCWIMPGQEIPPLVCQGFGFTQGCRDFAFQKERLSPDPDQSEAYHRRRTLDGKKGSWLVGWPRHIIIPALFLTIVRQQRKPKTDDSSAPLRAHAKSTFTYQHCLLYLSLPPTAYRISYPFPSPFLCPKTHLRFSSIAWSACTVHRQHRKLQHHKRSIIIMIEYKTKCRARGNDLHGVDEEEVEDRWEL